MTNSNSKLKPRRYLALAALLFFTWFLWQLFGPNPPIIVSKETTYITEPLLPSGMPDYRKYLLDKLRDGVTPENNAAVLLWQSIKPDDLKPEEYPIVAKEIGIDDKVVPQRLKSLYGQPNRERIAEFLSKQFSTTIGERDEIIYDAIGAAQSAPWKSDELSPLAEWIEENQQQLDMLVAASKRDRYFLPAASWVETTAAIDSLYDFGPAIPTARYVTYALSARAMWYAGANQFELAWQDISAIHRIARLVAQNLTITDQLSAIAIEGVAHDLAVTLLGRDGLPAGFARSILNDLNSLAPSTRFAEAFDDTDRVFSLFSIQNAREIGIGSFLKIMSMRETATFRPLDYLSIDWNVALRSANQRHDQLAAAFREQDCIRRKELLDRIGTDLSLADRQFRDPKAWLHAMISPSQRSELLAGEVVGSTTTLIAGLALALEATETTLEMERVVAALAVYHTEHHQYPDQLSALVPDILPELPNDHFNNRPLGYRRNSNGYLLYNFGENGIDDSGSHQYREIANGILLNSLPVEEADAARQQIPAGADDISLRLPRPPFKLPEPPDIP
jgi:hypothetical protein